MTIKSMSSENNNNGTNRRDVNTNYDNFNPFMMGMDLWQTAAMSWIATYNEFVKNASKMSEYWLNLLSNPWSIKTKEDKIKVE
ncbi:MAG TPA: hypothetical protein VFD60_10540 [Nitrososphaeraceae archaeon]|jgi:hypothetical protein|nr:hypothetical protein [Nitrososphaeraceae archaeon]